MLGSNRILVARDIFGEYIFISGSLRIFFQQCVLDILRCFDGAAVKFVMHFRTKMLILFIY